MAKIKLAPAQELENLKNAVGENKDIALPEIVVYEHGDFNGDSIRTNAACAFAGDLANEISSIIVISGTWHFYHDRNFANACGELKKGYYPNLAAVGIPNDSIESFQPVSYD